MAHFQRPTRGDFGEYDIDGKLAVGSVWRMRIPIGSAGAEIALWGGEGLAVRSNNPTAISVATSERREGDCRVLRLIGTAPATSMIEVGVWNGGSWAAGSPWFSLQAQATQLDRTSNGDNLVHLQAPHMALNASGSVVVYSMTYNATIVGGTPAPDVLAKVTHKVKHLVVSAHGYLKYDEHEIRDSIIALGSGISRADTGLFSRLKSVMAGGVIWLGGCALGNDARGNAERAQASGCYIVAPTMYMINERRGIIHRPAGTVDMFERYGPRAFAPDGTMLGWIGFLGLRHSLGFSW